MTIDFAVMSGAGNIFTVLDNRRYSFAVDDGRRLAPLLCSAAVAGRNTEGLMLIGPPTHPGMHFRMDFFNPDGSYGAMCGNGGRCAVRFAADAGIIQLHSTEPTLFTAVDAVYSALASGSTVRLEFPPAREIRFPCTILLDSTPITGVYVDVSSDHFAVDFASIAHLTGGTFDSFDIALWGARVRHHPDFPRGANANFYSVQSDGSVRLRTFERGVEAETGACGTGAISTALAVVTTRGAQPPVHITPTSGGALTVDIQLPLSATSSLFLEGDAVFLDRRTTTLDNQLIANS